MKLLRLQVQVLPWQDTGAATGGSSARKEVVLPWTEPCAENLTISELAERIETRFENIHKGKGKLKIKWLEDGYCGILDGNDTVSECFADRTGGMAHIKDFTVRVARYPPDPQELLNPARFASIAPESTARPQKRHRNDLLEQSTFGRHDYCEGNGACSATNKRQKVGGGHFAGETDPDRPILSSERDLNHFHEKPGPTEYGPPPYIIADSQPSPGKDQQNSYGTPQSLSVSSPQGHLARVRTELDVATYSPPQKSASDTDDRVQASIDTQPKSESPDPQSTIYSVPRSIRGSPVAGQDPVCLPAFSPFIKPSVPTSKTNRTYRSESMTAPPSSSSSTPLRRRECPDQGSITAATPERRSTMQNSLTKFGSSGDSHRRVALGRKLPRDIYEPIGSDVESSQDLSRLPSTKQDEKQQSLSFKPRPFSHFHTDSSDGQSQNYSNPDATDGLLDWPTSTLQSVENRNQVAPDKPMQLDRPISAEQVRCKLQPDDREILNLRMNRSSNECPERCLEAVKVPSELFGHRKLEFQQTDKDDTTSRLKAREGLSEDSGGKNDHGKDQDHGYDQKVKHRPNLSIGLVESDNWEYSNEQAEKIEHLRQAKFVEDSSAQHSSGLECAKAATKFVSTPAGKGGASGSGGKTQVQKAVGKESKVRKSLAANERKPLKGSQEKKTQDQRAQEAKQKKMDRKAQETEKVQAAAEQQENTRSLGSGPISHPGSEDSDRSIAPGSSGGQSGKFSSMIYRESEFSRDIPRGNTNLDLQVPLPSALRISPASSRRSVSFAEQPIEKPNAMIREALVKANGVRKGQYGLPSSWSNVELAVTPVVTSKKLATSGNHVKNFCNIGKGLDTSQKKQSKLRVAKTVEKGKGRAIDPPSPRKPSQRETVTGSLDSKTFSSYETGPEQLAVQVVAGPSDCRSTSSSSSVKNDAISSETASASPEPSIQLDGLVRSGVKTSKAAQAISKVRHESKSPSRSPAREVISSASSSSGSKSEPGSDSESASESAAEAEATSRIGLEVVSEDHPRPCATATESPSVTGLEKKVFTSSPVNTNGQKPLNVPETTLPTFQRSRTPPGMSNSDYEADQQLQREARQVIKPSHTPRVTVPKTPDTSQPSAGAGDNANKLRLNGLQPAYSRFPTMSGLKSNTSMSAYYQPSASKLVGCVVPMARFHSPLSSSTQANGSRISNGSSSESSFESSSSDEGDVGTSAGIGTSGSQGKSTRMMRVFRDIMNITRAL